MPKLSVVVPAYQVEKYLAECLNSILDQSYRALEVVVVDDGSTDATPIIADRFAAEDSRVIVIHQRNRGLGAARNVGTRAATGDYLAYADSDDVVSPGAYELLVGTLLRTASDIAIGAVDRFKGQMRFRTPLMRRNHERSAEAIRLEDAPLMLGDVFAWNKVYRRSFWEAAELTFPEDVRYEDQPTLTRALVAADRFDVLTETVYLWRVRTDGSSISQQRADLRDLHDRLLTKRWSTEVVEANVSTATRQVWFSQVLPIDMVHYFRSVPGCSAEYWAMLRSGVTSFWTPESVPFERTQLPLRQRLMGWLVSQDRRADLENFLCYLDRNPGPLPRRKVEGRVVVEHPFLNLVDLPDELREP